MKARLGLLLCAMASVGMSGCLLAPRAELNAAQAERRILAEQNRAQLVEIENLKSHGRELEDRVIRGEEQLATLEDQSRIDQRQLAGYRRERDGLYDQFQTMSLGGGRMPAELSRRLAELSERYPSLQFDPESGASKVDTDILFDSGEAVLKPGAARMLDELVDVLKSPAAGDLKIMVAGHTDNQLIAGRDVREKYPDNFHLSAARALAVADRMKLAGLPEHRLGVAGFGPYQPIASNTTAQERQKNRRVEIFVMAPDAPVVGWSETTPSVYSTSGVRR